MTVGGNTTGHLGMTLPRGIARQFPCRSVDRNQGNADAKSRRASMSQRLSVDLPQPWRDLALQRRLESIKIGAAPYLSPISISPSDAGLNSVRCNSKADSPVPLSPKQLTDGFVIPGRVPSASGRLVLPGRRGLRPTALPGKLQPASSAFRSEGGGVVVVGLSAVSQRAWRMARVAKSRQSQVVPANTVSCASDISLQFGRTAVTATQYSTYKRLHAGDLQNGAGGGSNSHRQQTANALPEAAASAFDGDDFRADPNANAFLRSYDSPGRSADGNGENLGHGGLVRRSGPSIDTLLTTHGVLMTLVFVAGYPIGAIMSRLIHRWFVHASWQLLVYCGMWAGFGVGIVVAHRFDLFFNTPHTRLGVFVVPLMGIQPLLGFLHHAYYRKYQHRGIISYIHIWYGRSLMIIGVVNGGLGIKYTRELGLIRPSKVHQLEIGYIVVASIMAAAGITHEYFGLRSRVAVTTTERDDIQNTVCPTIHDLNGPEGFVISRILSSPWETARISSQNWSLTPADDKIACIPACSVLGGKGIDASVAIFMIFRKRLLLVLRTWYTISTLDIFLPAIAQYESRYFAMVYAPRKPV
ncbi:hypothetical protein Purlil1_10992 [Purpureocillium lilacinum]|uniref:Cytochrome b561 domain-containing protein n=1 Tax=Purpureocillium lilacinum TaxID=33203 RepID=A0ABR0BKT0_PURLI|nr:hypothetical protein Purlil1_10992 [Purpureocillium lilacinum]